MTQTLNTLYVTTQGAYVSKDHETIVVKADEKQLIAVPMLAIGSLVCFGRVSVSPFLLGACAERGIGISYLTENGRFLARVEGEISGNVLLRREQYRKADDPSAAREFARAFVAGKLANYRASLRRYAREHTEPDKTQRLTVAAQSVQATLDNLPSAQTVDEVRGHEGEGSAAYFGAFDSAIHGPLGDFAFEKRSRRPPLNNLNALLSFLYVLVTHDCASALQAVGLDPAVGFLHADRPGRASLALDLVEEFRPIWADRLVLSLINLKQIKPTGFSKTDGGAVNMDDETRKAVLVAYQKRKQEEVTHPFTGEKQTTGLLPHLQARLLARAIRGELDAYPPYVLK
jgi:CRISPR-associated protein Cas1